jgi:hypothetical protein
VSAKCSDEEARRIMRRHRELFPQDYVCPLGRCGGDLRIRCEDPECATCADDRYCGASTPCLCTRWLQ